MESSVVRCYGVINNARGRNAAGFVFWGGYSRVERVEGWETVFALARDHEMLPACRAAFRRLKGRGSALARRSFGGFIQ